MTVTDVETTVREWTITETTGYGPSVSMASFVGTLPEAWDYVRRCMTDFSGLPENALPGHSGKVGAVPCPEECLEFLDAHTARCQCPCGAVVTFTVLPAQA